MRFPFLMKGDGGVQYPTLRPMTGIYLMHDNEMLLLHRHGSRIVDGLWVASAGGHMKPQEIDSPAKGVLREMREELGLSPDALEGLTMRYISLRSVGGEVRENYYFFAHLREKLPLTSNEGELRWVPMENVLALEMPFSAKHMLAHYLHTGRHDRRLYAAVAEGDAVRFIDMGQA